MVRIEWIICSSYADAIDYRGVLYLHEWHGKPFYWGVADKSFFGGHPRKRDGISGNGRYSNSYKHWIEGCLRHGARLYIGKLDSAIIALVEVENYLAFTYRSEMNVKFIAPHRQLKIEHFGEVPKFLTIER